MNKLKPAVLLITVLLLSAITSQIALADSVLNRSTTVFVVDRQALSQYTGGTDLAISFTGLVSNLQQGHHIIYVDAADPTNIIGAAQSGGPDFRKFEEQLKESLSSAAIEESDIVASLGSAYNFLDGQKAKAGSSVYVITGGSFNNDIASVSDQIALLANLYEGSAWTINGVALPNASPTTSDLLARFTEGTGGEVFELSVPVGLLEISRTLVRNDALGGLEQLGDGVVSTSDVFTAPLNVAPGTQETTMLFFKEDAFGSLRLSNPAGLEASDGDRAISSVVELPHVVIWNLVEPVSGQWRVDARAAQGSVSAWQFTSNKYSVGLGSFDSIPFERPSTLIGFVTDGEEKVTLDGVSILATVTNPDGSSFVKELNDGGFEGDAVAGDGFFSANIPPVGVKGDYEVAFELLWPEVGRSIVSQAQFTAQAFPSINVVPVQLRDIRPYERVKVATANIHVEGQPYAVSTSEIGNSLSADVDANGTIEIVPQRFIDQARAWEFDVFFTPAEETLHTLHLTLSMDYNGREYGFTSDSIVLSSIMPEAPIEQVSPPPAPQPQVVVEPQPPAEPVIEPTSSLPVQVAVISMAVLAALVTLAVVYWLSKTKPYGYIYTDRNELVADLSRIKRSTLRTLFSRSAITGDEIGARGIERVLFKFSGRNVGVASDQVTPTIRVNNQPLVGETSIQDRTWIGAHGKLYSFLTSPLLQPRGPEPMMGDD